MGGPPRSAAARLRWRCRRGRRELDLMLQAYLAQGYGEAAEAEQRQFERLLELPDDRLEDLLLGRTGVPEGEWGLLAAKIRSVSPL